MSEQEAIDNLKRQQEKLAKAFGRTDVNAVEMRMATPAEVYDANTKFFHDAMQLAEKAIADRNHALFLISAMCRRMRANRFVGDQEFMDTLAMAKKLVEEK